MFTLAQHSSPKLTPRLLSVVNTPKSDWLEPSVYEGAKRIHQRLSISYLIEVLGYENTVLSMRYDGNVLMQA